MRPDAMGLFWKEPPKQLRAAAAPKDRQRQGIIPPRLQVVLPPSKPPKIKKNPPLSDLIGKAIMDIECYSNYFLVKFMRCTDDFMMEFMVTEEKSLDIKTIRSILQRYEIFTFNGNGYDIPMLKLALLGANNQELKEASDKLIVAGMAPWNFEKHYQLPHLHIDHVDLIELCPGILSLKMYGGRLHVQKLQDLPIDAWKELTRDEMLEIATYCGNDLRVTKAILFDLFPQIELRRTLSAQHKIDLRSKSDAQIAETVIKSEMEKIKKTKIGKRPIEEGTFLYKAPEFLKFSSPQLQKALQIVTTQPFTIDHAGGVSMPKELQTLKIAIGTSVYQMGMGGLHSTESRTYHLADDEIGIFDWDVTSYYPSIILLCKLYPEHFGPAFLEVFRKLVEQRIAAKKAGDKVTADALKITINGTFGKLGSPFSILYSPDLMIQVTLTGQLSLLMLIEMMEKYGLAVVSGNTDGIVIKCPRDKADLMKDVIARWERRTGFEMESAEYAGLYSRDVNNYIAIKTDGEVKRKGVFKPTDITKNPQNEICMDAIIEYLKYGTPFEDTIMNCDDITKFLTLRTVNGGALQGKTYIGKAIRWYHAKGAKGILTYKTNGNKVPTTDGVVPLMNLPDSLPDDIDYAWYVRECRTLF